jgi:hypothetical protein
MMTGIAIVPLNCMGSAFPDDVSLRWQDFGERVPVIREESTVLQMLHFVVESLERCAITTTENPGDSSPAATVKCLDEPKLLFFDCMKCHISSNSIWVISPLIDGSSVLIPASRIHR